MAALLQHVRGAVARVRAWKPVRVMVHFWERRGRVLAAGMAYQAMFSVFAALWGGFAIAGLVIGANDPLRDALVEVIANAVPGLIDMGEGGAIKPADLFSAAVLGWTGAVAVVVALFTTAGWFRSTRDAVRTVADLPPMPTNVVLLRLRDAGVALAFGAGLLLSAALSLASTSALSWVLDLVGLDPSSPVATIAARVTGLAVTLGFDTVLLITLYHILAGVPIPARPLWQGAVLGAVALDLLKIAGSTLLGGTPSNPILASFAVIAGLLLWFNLVSQVILIGAAWIVVGARDAGVPLDPAGDRERLQAELRLRLEIEEQVRAELEADLPRAVRWLARRKRRGS